MAKNAQLGTMLGDVMAFHIKQLLQCLLPKQSDWKQVLLEHWPAIIGPLYVRVSIETIHEDQLVLGVQDSCWLQELYVLSPIIIKHVNQKLDSPRIKKIRFKQVNRYVGRITARESKAIFSSVNVTKQIQLNATERGVLERVEDPDLQAVLISYLIRCYRERE